MVFMILNRVFSFEGSMFVVDWMVLLVWLGDEVDGIIVSDEVSIRGRSKRGREFILCFFWGFLGVLKFF